MATAAIRNVGRIAAKNSWFFLCDMQEKFRPLIKYYPEVLNVASRLVKAASILDIPVICTEQYPKGLGNICSEIDISKAIKYEKTLFSMYIPDVVSKLQERPNAKTIVLFGIETQVCIQQTCLDLLSNGYEVHIVADAVSSRSLTDRAIAFERMKQVGALVTTCESILFELLGDSKHPNFKEVQSLIKDPCPDSGLLTHKL